MFKRAKTPIVFTISCVMTYAGAVNLGWSDFFWAIPFLVVMIVIAAKRGRKYGVATLLVLFLCGGLYTLKNMNTRIFYPALGMPVEVQSNACLYSSHYSDTLYVLEQSEDCDESSPFGSGSSMKPAGKLAAGDVYEIRQVAVSNPDFGEIYHFIVETEHGMVRVSPTSGFGENVFVGPDGEAIVKADLRRGIFYYPSMLMAYPILPFILLSLFR